MWSEHGPTGLTTQGEHKPPARLSSKSRHSQSKLLRNCLNFCKPPPRFYRIKPVCTCVNEWACLCFCPHKCGKNRPDPWTPHDPSPSRDKTGSGDKVFYLSDKQWSWTRVHAGHWHGWAQSNMKKERFDSIHNLMTHTIDPNQHVWGFDLDNNSN